MFHEGTGETLDFPLKSLKAQKMKENAQTCFSSNINTPDMTQMRPMNFVLL